MKDLEQKIDKVMGEEGKVSPALAQTMLTCFYNWFMEYWKWSLFLCSFLTKFVSLFEMFNVYAAASNSYFHLVIVAKKGIQINRANICLTPSLAASGDEASGRRCPPLHHRGGPVPERGRHLSAARAAGPGSETQDPAHSGRERLDRSPGQTRPRRHWTLRRQGAGPVTGHWGEMILLDVLRSERCGFCSLKRRVNGQTLEGMLDSSVLVVCVMALGRLISWLFCTEEDRH